MSSHHIRFTVETPEVGSERLCDLSRLKAWITELDETRCVGLPGVNYEAAGKEACSHW